MSQARDLKPGSRDARDAGCKCPVLDNAHGRGWMGGVVNPVTNEAMYVVNANCPIHGRPSLDDLAREGGLA